MTELIPILKKNLMILAIQMMPHIELMMKTMKKATAPAMTYPTLMKTKEMMLS